MKLSIIIPVYGVEQYIEKCLRSVFKQDVPDTEYEVILINDGTKDNSWDITKKICKNHLNVVLYEQENQGLSAARNKGLSLAKGEYVWFVDSDDWIDENCLSTLLSCVEGNDVLALSSMYEEGDWSKIKKYKVSENVQDKLSYMEQDHPTPAQFYICKREFIENYNISFTVGIKHEDCLFTPIVIAQSRKFAIYHKPVYHFLKRPNSITTVIDCKRGYDYCYIIENLYNYRDKIDSGQVLNRYDYIISRIIKAHLSIAYRLDVTTQSYIEDFYREHKEILLCLKESKFNSKLVFYIYKYTPFKLIFIYEILEVLWKKIKK